MIKVKKDQLEALYRELNLADTDFFRAQGSLDAVKHRLDSLRDMISCLERDTKDKGSKPGKPQSD